MLSLRFFFFFYLNDRKNIIPHVAVASLSVCADPGGAAWA